MAITTDRVEQTREHAADRASKQSSSVAHQHHNGQPHVYPLLNARCGSSVGLEFSEITQSQQQQQLSVRQRHENLGRWAHIWTKRQGPEWKPRRASVATCQRPQLQHYQQQQSLYHHQHQQHDHNLQERNDSTDSLKSQSTSTTSTNNNRSILEVRKKKNSLQPAPTATIWPELLESADEQKKRRSKHPEVLLGCTSSRKSADLSALAVVNCDGEDGGEDGELAGRNGVGANPDELNDLIVSVAAGGSGRQSSQDISRNSSGSNSGNSNSSSSRSSSSSSSSRSASQSSQGSTGDSSLVVEEEANRRGRRYCSQSTSRDILCCCCNSASAVAAAATAAGRVYQQGSQQRPSELSTTGETCAKQLTSKQREEGGGEEEEVNRSSSWSSSSRSCSLCWLTDSAPSKAAANGLPAALTAPPPISTPVAAAVAREEAAANSGSCSCSWPCSYVSLVDNKSQSAKNKLYHSVELSEASPQRMAVNMGNSGERIRQQRFTKQQLQTTNYNKHNEQSAEQSSLQIQEQQRKSLIEIMNQMGSEECLQIGPKARSGLSHPKHHQHNQFSSSNNNNNNDNDNCPPLKRRDETTTLSSLTNRAAAATTSIAEVNPNHLSSSHDSGYREEVEQEQQKPSARHRRRGEIDLERPINGFSVLASPQQNQINSLINRGSSTVALTSENNLKAEAEAEVEVEGSGGERQRKAAIVESWLDDNPEFVRDYFIRKADRRLIDDWLRTNTKLTSSAIAPAAFTSSTLPVGLAPTQLAYGAIPLSGFVAVDSCGNPTTTTTSDEQAQARRHKVMTSVGGELGLARSQGNSLPQHQQRPRRLEEEHQRQESELGLELELELPPSGPSATMTSTETGTAVLRSHRSNSQSGGRSRLSSPMAMPVRKISATDFETRTGSGYLRPMVSRAPDGRPTFLSQLDVRSSCSLDKPGEHLFDKEKYQIQIERERRRQQPGQECGCCPGEQSPQQAKCNDELSLIFELVKNICNDLDIRTLLHKILKNIAVLINADKSSLFLVSGGGGGSCEPTSEGAEATGRGEKHLVSHLFNVDQESDEYDMERMNDCGRSIVIPWGVGLVGYVAASGESINIANCYEDPRFTNTIDQQTGYKTRNMLCAPILDKRNEIVGVAQVINKRDGNQFSKADELKFNRYLQFCGIGLRNAQSYENCQLENKRNQVILDLARIIFEEQSTIEQVVHKIILHTQSLLDCERCQVLLIDDGSENLEQLLQIPALSMVSPSASTATGDCSRPTAAADDGRQQQQHLHVNTRPKWRPQCRNSSIDSGAGSRSSTSPGCESSSDTNEDGYKPQQQDQHQEQQQQKTNQTTTGDDDERFTSKLFSLVFDLECSGTNSDLVMHNRAGGGGKADGANDERRFPINIGITGYVAMTGKTLNIEDAHKCERFDPSVDENSKFKHKSILCMPIRNGRRKIIGVSQLINKKNGRPFNKNDEDLFEAFSIFCGLGIHNTLMYEKVVKIMAKQRVTFEVLSYHATAPREEAAKLHAKPIPSTYALSLTSLVFNDFSLDEQFMLKSCLRFFLDLDLMRRFQIDRLDFCNWILSVQKNYRSVTYHPIVG